MAAMNYGDWPSVNEMYGAKGPGRERSNQRGHTLGVPRASSIGPRRPTTTKGPRPATTTKGPPRPTTTRRPRPPTTVRRPLKTGPRKPNLKKPDVDQLTQPKKAPDESLTNAPTNTKIEQHNNEEHTIQDSNDCDSGFHENGETLSSVGWTVFRNRR